MVSVRWMRGILCSMLVGTEEVALGCHSQHPGYRSGDSGICGCRGFDARTNQEVRAGANPKRVLDCISSVFNFTVPWLSILAIIVLAIAAVVLYYIPLRYLVLAFVINKFTKRFRKPKGYIDNNELADFISRLPSDPELVRIRTRRSTTPRTCLRLVLATIPRIESSLAHSNAEEGQTCAAQWQIGEHTETFHRRQTVCDTTN